MGGYWGPCYEVNKGEKQATHVRACVMTQAQAQVARPRHEWCGMAPMNFLHLQIVIDAMFEEATIFTRLQTSSLGLNFASPLLRLVQLIPNPRGPEGIEGDFIPYNSKSPSLLIPSDTSGLKIN